jgi:uncharacterized protein YutE (UPF0331/DUF86 family)
MRIIGLIALIAVLFASLFKVAGADLTNNVTAVALMVLLISLFSDLKDFNFWGLKGTAKEEKKLKDLKGEEGISQTKQPKVTENKVQQVMRQETVVLMDNEKGNFLALAFDIERLLRIGAAVLAGEADPSTINAAKTIEILKSNGVLTSAGQEQIESIRWLKNMLIQGRENELAEDTLKNGIELAYDLYMELKNWLDTTPSPKSSSKKNSSR